ncbi:MAG: hypothetical protein H0U49_06500 [Parachlamydiaceae bacterium]|nr:hypothetical protein [Parachlamydiaceae bacterium]
MDKDRLANPQKPLAQGVLTKHEVLDGINILQIGLTIYGVLIAFGIHILTGILLIVLVGYTCLLARNFYMTDSITRYPLFQICFHHLYAWPLAFLAISAHTPDNTFNFSAWSYGTLIFCAFCLYELCHQLNPQAHPVQASALNFYGYKIVFAFASFLLCFALLCALFLGLDVILFPFDLALFLTFLLLFFNHRLFYATEFTAAISLIAHSWAGAFL